MKSKVDRHEARLYKRLDGGRVRCDLCEHRCVIDDGQRGICGVRENSGGTLYTLVYGRTIARHVDPVEKKPLFHFHPGSSAYSMATPGCNFTCAWCQNWQISQMPRERDIVAGDAFTPEQLVADARRLNCRSIAYTYTEPTVFFEYACDTARIAHEQGLANFFISNGYMSEEMLAMIAPGLDAVNIDLKAFRDKTYREYVGARLKPILRNLERIKQLGIWLEVTTLVIPGINDSESELRDTAAFIVEKLGAETPWHISRFFPNYRMDGIGPTPAATLARAYELGQKAGLHYVYLGNTGDGEDTFCHQCGQRLIERHGYRIRSNRIAPDSSCPDCGAKVAGVAMSHTLARDKA